MIEVDFNILNQKGSPALYQDTFANRPSASLQGRIFLATDTGNLYRDTGTTWTAIAGGGGTAGIDSVLSINQKLTADRDIDCDNKEFLIQNAKLFTIENQSGNIFFQQSGGIVRFGDLSNSGNQIKFILDDTNKIITTNYLGVPVGIKLDFNNSGFFLGDVNGNFTNTNLVVDTLNKTISTLASGYVGSGLSVNYIGNFYYLGDYVKNNLGTTLVIDDSLMTAGFFDAQSNYQGLKLDFLNASYYFGQIGGGSSNVFLKITDSLASFEVYDGINNNGIQLDFINDTHKFFGVKFNTGITLQDNSTGGKTIQMYCNTPIQLDDNGTGNFLEVPSGGSAGLHWVVQINGTKYKIKLDNY